MKSDAAERRGQMRTIARPDNPESPDMEVRGGGYYIGHMLMMPVMLIGASAASAATEY